MRLGIRSKPALAALILACALPLGTATASSLEISPVSVILIAGQTVKVVEIRNRGGSAVAVQLRAFAWSQAGDTDVLTPTKDLILSPPIFTVPPGASQTIRLLLRAKGGTSERSYRLLIDEVPTPNAKTNQVGIAFRISMPVIAAPTAVPARQISWKAQRGPGNQILVSAVNSGNVYDKVHAIAVTFPNGTQPKVATTGGNPYVLPGAQRQWTVPGATTSLRLKVTTQAGTSEHDLAVDP